MEVKGGEVAQFDLPKLSLSASIRERHRNHRQHYLPGVSKSHPSETLHIGAAGVKCIPQIHYYNLTVLPRIRKTSQNPHHERKIFDFDRIQLRSARRIPNSSALDCFSANKQACGVAVRIAGRNITRDDGVSEPRAGGRSAMNVVWMRWTEGGRKAGRRWYDYGVWINIASSGSVSSRMVHSSSECCFGVAGGLLYAVAVLDQIVKQLGYLQDQVVVLPAC